MEEEFRAILLAEPGVAAITPRIGWGDVPQGAQLPYVVLWVVSDSGGHSLDGPESLSEARVQADCYGPTYGQAKALARAVRRALDGYLGGTLQGVFHSGTRDTREGGSDEWIRPFRVSLDFIVNYNLA